MRTKLLAAATAAALATLTFATTAQANHSWGGYHWARTSNPFTATSPSSSATTSAPPGRAT